MIFLFTNKFTQEFRCRVDNMVRKNNKETVYVKGSGVMHGIS